MLCCFYFLLTYLRYCIEIEIILKNLNPASKQELCRGINWYLRDVLIDYGPNKKAGSLSGLGENYARRSNQE